MLCTLRGLRLIVFLFFFTDQDKSIRSRIACFHQLGRHLKTVKFNKITNVLPNHQSYSKSSHMTLVPRKIITL